MPMKKNGGFERLSWKSGSKRLSERSGFELLN